MIKIRPSCLTKSRKAIRTMQEPICPSQVSECKENTKEATEEVFGTLHNKVNMQEFPSGAIRENKNGKGRCDLLPMCALLRLARHFEKANVDHPERNWEKGIPMHSFIDSALRHLMKYMDGWNDEDHLCAASWNILCAMWTEEKKPEMQDIPSRLVHEKSE